MTNPLWHGNLCTMPVGGCPKERFYEKIHKSEGSLNTECWVWRVCKDRHGYGQFGYLRKVVSAHRFSYELHKGPIPEGLDLDHLCRNRACVNPDHLEPVTRLENIMRGDGPELARKRNLARTHCKHGHEFTPENTYVRSRKGSIRRECRKCHAIRERFRRTSV